MFYLELDEFRHADSRASQKANDEIPSFVSLFEKLILEKCVVRIRNDVVKVCLLLYLDDIDLELRFLEKDKILVDPLDPKIDGLGFVMVDEEVLVLDQASLGQRLEDRIVVAYGERVRVYRVLREIGVNQITSKRRIHRCRLLSRQV